MSSIIWIHFAAFVMEVPMKRIQLLLQTSMIAIILSTLTVFGAEPWKDKAWSNWTADDLKKILTNSPWTQPVYVPYHPLTGGEDIEPPPPSLRIGHINDPNPLESHPVFRPDQVFLARWESAKIIRSALCRSAELGLPYTKPSLMEPEDSEEAAKAYVIAILSDPLNRLPLAYKDRLKENTVLIFHRSGRRLLPTQVVIRYALKASNPEAFEFYFSRTDETDRELSREHQVDFRAQVGPRIFQARFNPAKMSTRQGRDF